MTAVKICGLTTRETLAAAAPADYAGFVFYPSSPRALTIAAASTLAPAVPKTLKLVGLFVDPDNALLEQTLSAVPLAMIQLHGSETPQRVRDIAALTRRPVMKALRVGDENDVRCARDYEAVADWLLFDARNDDEPGGTGRKFDWSLLAGFKSRLTWMLAGGLNAANVGSALSQLQPDAVDVSSGVESARGVKDAGLIADFIKTVRNA